MKEAGQKVALSGDGQFDSPGLSNSSYGIIYEFWFEHSMCIMNCHLVFQPKHIGNYIWGFRPRTVENRDNRPFLFLCRDVVKPFLRYQLICLFLWC